MYMTPQRLYGGRDFDIVHLHSMGANSAYLQTSAQVVHVYISSLIVIQCIKILWPFQECSIGRNVHYSVLLSGYARIHESLLGDAPLFMTVPGGEMANESLQVLQFTVKRMKVIKINENLGRTMGSRWRS